MYIDNNQGGLLRLHQTYRHDLKCYTSDEGRCQKTAAAFLKGLLELEGALAPVLAIMVRNDDVVQEMLNDSTEAADMLKTVKTQLSGFMHSKIHLRAKYQEQFQETPSICAQKYFDEIGEPYERLHKIYECI